MANMVSYADESGTHDESGNLVGADVAGVFGYIATKEQWDSFTVSWDAILTEFKITEFHASEFADRINGPKNPNWPYAGWIDSKRDSFIRQLIETARDSTAFSVGGLLSVQGYDRFTPERMKQAMEHPYQYCFQAFLDHLVPALEVMVDPPLQMGDKVDFFFDQQDEMEIRADRTFSIVKCLRDSNARMGTLTFADGLDYVPLQAADLLAYVMRQSASRKRKGDMRIKPGGWEAQLIERKNVIMGYCSDESLEKMLRENGVI